MTDEDWLPIRYRDFYDVPRLIAVEFRHRTYLLDSRFDDERDDHADHYALYRLPADQVPRLESRSWEGLIDAGELVGRIPVQEVRFDATRRECVHATVFERLAQAALTFRAGAVAFTRDDDLGSETLVLAETPDGRGQWLEIQRALAVDEQDRALGHDTYCLVNEAGATVYGGVERWTVGDELVLWLSAAAADVLQAENGYRIGLPTPEARHQARQAMASLMR